MQPINPTQDQLNARLNPTPVTINTPTSGLWRSGGDNFPSQVFKTNADGSYSSFSLTDLGKQQLLAKDSSKDQYGDYNAFSGLDAGDFGQVGSNYLKSTYGIDWNSLSKYLPSDLGIGYGKIANKVTDLGSFFGNPTQATNGGTITENNTPNTLGTPSTAMSVTSAGGTQPLANGGTAQGKIALPGSVTAPTTALQPGSTDTASVKALQDYLVAQGLMKQSDLANGGYGVYGPLTTAAVAKLQTAQGVDNTGGVGYYGPKTIASLQGASNPTYSAPSSISSATMQGSGAATNFTTPGATTSSTNDMAALTANYQQQLAAAQALGPQDQKESDLNQLLQSLNTQEAGKADYQNQQNSIAGVDAKQSTINSLQATIKQNLDAYNAAQLQDQQGQGVTTAVDDRQRAAVTKQYAINSLATSSLLAAAQGDLANAQLLANKAVAAKFDPIEAQITASQQNLQLIINDPKTTAEEKAQAQAIASIQTAQAAAVAQAKSNAADVLKIGTDAAANSAQFIATAQYQTAAQALQAIKNSNDPIQATQIAESTGLSAISTAVKEVNGRQVLYNTKTGATIKDLGSATSTADSQKNAAISTAYDSLYAARGSDGYTDPNLYARIRANSTLAATEFDNKFGYLVNPASQARLGISTGSANTPLKTSFSSADVTKLSGAGFPTDQLEAYVNQYGIQAFVDNNPNMTQSQKDALNAVYGTSF